MSIWGSLIGGFIGFSTGALLECFLASYRRQTIKVKFSSHQTGSTAQQQQIFALSLIVLSAKLSKPMGMLAKKK